MHEILTVQLGQRANYLATHFWNTQESYFTYAPDEEPIIDHDIHFRPGIGADGSETFTPRTVIYDLKGGFGSLRKINALYELEDNTPQNLWNGQPVVQRQPVIPQNAYLQSLDQGLTPPQLTTDSVRYWSDFSRVYFHPRSIVQLNEYDLHSSLMPFEKWTMGEELFSSLDKEHDLLDRDLRPFAEEADQMQGIQLMASTDDAWGGFASRYLERIRDEYGKVAVWVWGLEDNDKNIPRDKQFIKLSNSARALSEISPQASVFIPMSLPSAASLPSYVTMDRTSLWHTSALLSTAFESATMPSRLKANRQSLDELAVAFNINGNQNIAKLRMSISSSSPSYETNGDRPSRLAHGQQGDHRMASSRMDLDGEDMAEDEPTTLDIDFFPGSGEENGRANGYGKTAKRTHVFGQIESLRGGADGEGDEMDVDGEEDEGYERARRRAQGLTLSHKTRTPLAFPLLDSFPHIYSQASSGTTPSVAVHTSLSTDTSVSLRLKKLREIVGRAVGMEEREQLGNSLGEIREAYEEGWSEGSDSDDD